MRAFFVGAGDDRMHAAANRHFCLRTRRVTLAERAGFAAPAID